MHTTYDKHGGHFQTRIFVVGQNFQTFHITQSYVMPVVSIRQKIQHQTDSCQNGFDCCQ